jgi:hypothetical protein
VYGRRSFSHASSNEATKKTTNKRQKPKRAPPAPRVTTCGSHNPLFQWLKSLPGYAGLKRQEALRFANETFPHRLDRDDAMKNCYSQFDVLIRSHTKRGTPPSHAVRIPIIGVSAAPGSGKSYFLDEC